MILSGLNSGYVPNASLSDDESLLQDVIATFCRIQVEIHNNPHNLSPMRARYEMRRNK
jgi:hypothetical protein